MDEMKVLTDKLQYIFLKNIIVGLQDKSLEVDQARNLGKSFLTLVPFQSVEDAKEKIATYVSQNSRFSSLDEYMKTYNEERKINDVIEKMKVHIQNNNFDEALTVAKKY